MTLTVFSTEFCPRCEELKTWLKKNGYTYNEMDMASVEGLTELRFRGIFTNMAPVLMSDNLYLLSDGMFASGTLNESQVAYLARNDNTPKTGSLIQEMPGTQEWEPVPTTPVAPTWHEHDETISSVAIRDGDVTMLDITIKVVGECDDKLVIAGPGFYGFVDKKYIRGDTQ